MIMISRGAGGQSDRLGVSDLLITSWPQCRSETRPRSASRGIQDFCGVPGIQGMRGGSGSQGVRGIQ
eukprot:15437254-Alexandrium_andersonii.AAC.1